MSAAPWLQCGVLSLGGTGQCVRTAGCEQACQSALEKGLATVLSSREAQADCVGGRKDVCAVTMNKQVILTGGLRMLTSASGA